MCRVIIESPAVNVTLDVKPSADFITCLIPALLAALPAFIDGLMGCLAGNTGGGGYKPGARPRCN